MSASRLYVVLALTYLQPQTRSLYRAGKSEMNLDRGEILSPWPPQCRSRRACTSTGRQSRTGERKKVHGRWSSSKRWCTWIYLLLAVYEWRQPESTLYAARAKLQFQRYTLLQELVSLSPSLYLVSHFLIKLSIFFKKKGTSTAKSC